MQTGMVCNLTLAKPTFETSCPNFVKDETVPEIKHDDNQALSTSEIKERLPIEISEKLRLEQNLPFAVIFGSIAALVGAALWAAITVATEYQIGYMALGVGALVGVAVRFTGKGIDHIFGIIGAALSLAGCVFGNFLSIVGMIAKENSLNFFDVFSNFQFNMIVQIMVETFSPMDIVFYGLAVYTGFKLSIRKITEKTLMDMKLQQQ
jgi:hypothetical protein